MSNRVLLAMAITSIAAATMACGHRQHAAASSYTIQTNNDTAVTVTPPPPNAAISSSTSTTTTTGAALSVDARNSAGGAERHPLLTDAPQSSHAPGHPNSVLGETIRQSLRTDEKLSDIPVDRIRITTIDGQVTLTGAVPTVADKVEIEQRVREVKGVEQVDNQIDIVATKPR